MQSDKCRFSSPYIRIAHVYSLFSLVQLFNLVLLMFLCEEPPKEDKEPSTHCSCKRKVTSLQLIFTLKQGGACHYKVSLVSSTWMVSYVACLGTQTCSACHLSNKLYHCMLLLLNCIVVMRQLTYMVMRVLGRNGKKTSCTCELTNCSPVFSFIGCSLFFYPSKWQCSIWLSIHYPFHI